jgi:multidrug efflux pump subunit AcrA (membrane-fusion protein)
MPVNETNQAQIEGLATLLVLDEEIRKLTNVREFGFFSTNETHRLIPYHTAYLWQLKEFIGTHLVAQSGTAEIDVHASVNQWLMHKISKIRLSSIAKEIHQINFEPTGVEAVKLLANSDLDWSDVLPYYLLWCPLLDKSKKLTGGLIFFRETAFTEAEVKKLTWLIASYQYTWLMLVRPQKIPSWEKLKQKHYLLMSIFVIVCMLLFPIRLSVFGDGTVVPNKSQVLINAPLQGVIKAFSVKPGDKVQAGQLLLTIDKTDAQASVEVSKKDFLLTQAKLRTAINEGFDSKESRAEIPIIQAQLAIDKANLDYANELLAKTDVRSPIAGIVIFESTEDWVGQPVQTGERILVIADPLQVELKIILPVANILELAVGNKGELFLYGQLSSLPIRLTMLGYNAKLMPNKILAYQLKADFSDSKDLPQLGAQGTVKIYGHYVPFIYYLLRRPLQALRQSWGI